MSARRTSPTSSKQRVTIAKLVGAYERRRDLEHRGLPTVDADERIAELEGALSAELVDQARSIATPGQSMIVGDGAGLRAPRDHLVTTQDEGPGHSVPREPRETAGHRGEPS